MKLPLWLRCLVGISALLVLVVVGWWWITWPERTARRYLQFVSEGNLELAKKMLRPDQAKAFWTDRETKRIVRTNLEGVRLEPLSRTVPEVIMGERSFNAYKGDLELGAVLRVARGKVLPFGASTLQP
jgi:hypothetical protein